MLVLSKSRTCIIFQGITGNDGIFHPSPNVFAVNDLSDAAQKIVKTGRG